MDATTTNTSSEEQAQQATGAMAASSATAGGAAGAGAGAGAGTGAGAKPAVIGEEATEEVEIPDAQSMNLVRRCFYVYETTEDYERVRRIQGCLEELGMHPKATYTAKLSRLMDWDAERKQRRGPFVPNRDAKELRAAHCIVGPDGARARDLVFKLDSLARDPEIQPHYTTYSAALRMIDIQRQLKQLEAEYEG